MRHGFAFALVKCVSLAFTSYGATHKLSAALSHMCAVAPSPPTRSQAEHSSRAAAEADDADLRRDFDRLLEAAVAAREDTASRAMAEAAAMVEAAEERAR
jgi:hypothetical protein